jgi:hypothetical protein
MAIKSTGQLSFSEIVAEFADTAPYSLSEFYRGAGKVPTNNTNVPASGAISFSSFYNAVNRITVNYTISSHTQQATLNPTSFAGYVAGISDITITVDSGIYVWSDSVSTPALTINGGLASGDTIKLVNNGYIIGKGGAGGGTLGAPPAPSPAGDALSINLPLSITNNSYIAGGGGGGSFAGGGGAGGGAGGRVAGNAGEGAAGGSIGNAGNNGSWSSTGGGGGRQLPGLGGSGSQGGGAGGGGYGYSGSYGAYNPGGNGGSAGNNGNNCPTSYTGGGGGGGWGATGGRGYYYGYYQPAGGAGGKAIKLNGYSVTWMTNGTVYGAVS